MHLTNGHLTCASNVACIVGGVNPDHSGRMLSLLYGENDATHNACEDDDPRDRTPYNQANARSTGGCGYNTPGTPRSPRTEMKFRTRR